MARFQLREDMDSAPEIRKICTAEKERRSDQIENSVHLEHNVLYCIIEYLGLLCAGRRIRRSYSGFCVRNGKVLRIAAFFAA